MQTIRFDPRCSFSTRSRSRDTSRVHLDVRHHFECCFKCFLFLKSNAIFLRQAFKPTSTIGQLQNTVTRGGEETTMRGKGRHDPCVLPRAAPMVEVCMMRRVRFGSECFRSSLMSVWPQSRFFFRCVLCRRPTSTTCVAVSQDKSDNVRCLV